MVYILCIHVRSSNMFEDAKILKYIKNKNFLQKGSKQMSNNPFIEKFHNLHLLALTITLDLLVLW